jgi:hypothetical protein
MQSQSIAATVKAATTRLIALMASKTVPGGEDIRIGSFVILLPIPSPVDAADRR